MLKLMVCGNYLERGNEMKISLDKTVRAMSIALDLAEIYSMKEKGILEEVSNINYSEHKFTNHSKRAAYIAMKAASVHGLTDENMKLVYLSALLHDIGATNSLESSHASEEFIRDHCFKGSEIIEHFPVFERMSDVILFHHENYNGTGPVGLREDEIPVESQIVRLADLVELIYDDKIPPLKQRDRITHWVKANSGIIFSPEMVDTFLKISSIDMFWFDLENISFVDSVLDESSPDLNIELSLDEFEAIAYIFANIIDSKSKFTATHSRGISELAFNTANYLGYSEEKSKKMKIAGLLHDIGKLAIPSGILDKNGSLTDEEFLIIKSHVYYTWIILDKIGDIKDICEWSSNHHEKLNGSGYPRRLTSKDLSEEARIMAVCDIYQALTEDRPYRDGLNKDKAFEILNNMSNENLICKNALNSLKNSL